MGNSKAETGLTFAVTVTIPVSFSVYARRLTPKTIRVSLPSASTKFVSNFVFRLSNFLVITGNRHQLKQGHC